MSDRLLIQLTTDDPERVAIALTVGMTAASAGVPVELWLSGPATMFAVPGQQPALDLEFAPDLNDALDSVGPVKVCSQCAARRGLSEDDLRLGARIAGAAALVESLLTPGTQAVTY